MSRIRNTLYIKRTISSESLFGPETSVVDVDPTIQVIPDLDLNLIYGKSKINRHKDATILTKR